jgi:dihydrofolate reductase
MKIILNMAISPNGLIAREDGSEDWLLDENWDDFLVDARRYNNIVMGRETFSQVAKWDEEKGFDQVPAKYKIVVTRNTNFTVPAGYSVMHSPELVINFLEQQGITTLFLIGGGKLNSAFMKRKLVTEIELTVNPYIIGKGRSFLSPDECESALELVDCKVLTKGRVRLRYRVK